MKKQLNKGDIIKRVTSFSSQILTVNRVTKTEAILVGEDINCQIRYRREYEIWDEKTGRCKLIPVPHDNWISLIEYYLIKSNDNYE